MGPLTIASPARTEPYTVQVVVFYRCQQSQSLGARRSSTRKFAPGNGWLRSKNCGLGRLRTLGIDEVSDPDVIDLAGPNRAPGVLARLDSPRPNAVSRA